MSRALFTGCVVSEGTVKAFKGKTYESIRDQVLPYVESCRREGDLILLAEIRENGAVTWAIRDLEPSEES
jgi:hypothetical protein